MGSSRDHGGILTPLNAVKARVGGLHHMELHMRKSRGILAGNTGTAESHTCRCKGLIRGNQTGIQIDSPQYLTH